MLSSVGRLNVYCGKGIPANLVCELKVSELANLVATSFLVTRCMSAR